MYNKFFGFKESPFNLAPNPHFFFHSTIHREALARLTYGLQERVGFILITGEIGSGKTTLINTLLENVGENILTACINNTRIGEVELLREILNEFELESDSWNKSELIKALNNFLLEKHAQGLNVVLIIDEAQNLTLPVLEEIRLLSNLETKKEKLLQLILVGQPELKSTINRPELRQLRQRITVSYHIDPLSKQETVSYIMHRLKIAGSKNCKEFNKKALNRIYGFTKGIPRLINTIADNSLLIAYVAEKKIVTEAMVEEAIKDYTTANIETKSRKKKNIDQALQERMDKLEYSISKIREDILSLENKLSSISETKDASDKTPSSPHEGKEMGEGAETANIQEHEAISFDKTEPAEALASTPEKKKPIEKYASYSDSAAKEDLNFPIFDDNFFRVESDDFEYTPEFVEKILFTILFTGIKKKVDFVLINPDDFEYKIKIKKEENELDFLSLPMPLAHLIFDKLRSIGSANNSDSWSEKIIKVKYQQDLFYINVSILPIAGEMRGVLSFQYRLSEEERDFSFFGFSGDFISAFERLLQSQNGIIIISGPQNSGKSKFLYATMNRLDPCKRNIISLERNIINRVKNVSQIELSTIPPNKISDIPSKMLFQRPDVIVIPHELDRKVLEELLKLSSQMLILVEICSDNLNDLIGQLHGITRLNVVYKNILAIVQLRKLKNLCPFCKTSYKPSQQLMELIKKVTNMRINRLYTANGCPECDETGYHGFSYIQRMSLNTGKLSRYFKNKNLLDTSLPDISQEENNKLIKKAFLKLSEGKTSFEEVKQLFF